MYRVTRLNPVSWAKVFTLTWLVIACLIGLIFVLPFAVFGGMAALMSEDLRPLAVAIPAGLLGGLVGLALAAGAVFVISLVQAAVFSWALGRTGGLEVDLALGPGFQPTTPAPPPADAAAASELPPPPAEAPAVEAPPAGAELPAPELQDPPAWPAEATPEPSASAVTPPEGGGDPPAGPA